MAGLGMLLVSPRTGADGPQQWQCAIREKTVVKTKKIRTNNGGLDNAFNAYTFNVIQLYHIFHSLDNP
ncbi:hypothetical protein Slin15195_G013660 [Septoria linicola]|uniref:Uncharacterized protein n=1 Tax=Septoria linicola TaxID=215465 RepID=A0A9Q9EFU4_9PEZI|nr:hypothetical protein Slin15195_G013660 [Septoria linicola]